MKYTKHAVLGLFVTSVLLSGCTAPAKSADATKEEPKTVQTETQQEEPAQKYSAVGSWIPRKVKKKEDIIGTNTQTANGEALGKAQQQGMSRMQKDPSAPPPSGH